MDKNLNDITVEELKKEIDNGKALEWEIWTKATKLEKELNEYKKWVKKLMKYVRHDCCSPISWNKKLTECQCGLFQTAKGLIKNKVEQFN